MKLEGAFVIDHGVAGVAPTTVPDHGVNPSGKVVDNLPFALVAPLAADYCLARHLSP
jgi:hypothetical protein